MINKFIVLLLSFAFLLGQTLCDGFFPEKVWENLEYQKLIDVKHAHINEALELSIRNIGNGPADEYYLALPKEVYDKISMFAVQLSDKHVFVNSSLFPATSDLDDGSQLCYGLIKLPSPVAPGAKVALSVRISHNRHGVPYPEHIAIKDEQNLLLSTSRLPLSAYSTKKGNLRVIGSPKFSELDESDDSSLKGEESKEGLTFGPWEDIKPFETANTLNMIYSHNIPVIEATQLNRDVWISHWASTIQFEEYYELINRSAKLNKGFSRFELMKEQQGMKLSHYCSVLEMKLPEESSDHYYTDLVGMVSTSRILGDHMYLKPRYPLFGGWKYNFTVGWTNKLSSFLHKSKLPQESYLLSIPLLNGPSDILYDNVALSVFLPEGAQVQAIDPPVPFVDIKVTTQKSYLDLNNGHVKVTCNFKNLIGDIGNGSVLVKYTYDSNALYRKPLSVALYIFVALMSIFLLKSINFNVDEA